VPEDKRPSWVLILAYLTVALGLPSAAAAVKWHLVAAHPVLGAALLSAAAILVGLIGLGHEIWRKKYSDRVIDGISTRIEWRIAHFGRSYRKCLLADLRFVDQKGLPGRFFDPELNDVYVDVAMRRRDPHEVREIRPSDLADLPAAGQRSLIGDFLGRPKPRVLAVIGAPGSGKTTLLRHTAREMCLSRRRRSHRDLPILLYLRDHVATIVAEPAVALPVLVSSELTRYGLAERAGWLEHRLHGGECVVMLDGLDEVARQEDREAVSEWVRLQAIRYPDNDFVVTSRPLGYQSAPIEGAIALQTQPFTPEQVDRFVHRWYLAEERGRTGAEQRRRTSAEDRAVTRRAQERADELIARLRAAPALRKLTVNPLLLTMIATVHRPASVLPGSRAELYTEICQFLLWRSQDAKKLHVEPRGSQRERLMRILAFEMMARKVRDLSTADAITILRPVLRRMTKNVTPEDFLEDVAANGLFIERESGSRAFAHQTFQEYLAAAHIRDENRQDVLAGAVGDVWWRETTLLYVAGADAGPIVEACLAASSISALTLAFDCAREAGELAEDLREKVDGLLDEGLTHGDGPQRRLLTGVAVARDLAPVVETGAGTRVCSHPVTFGLYRLFLEDMTARGEPCLLDAPPGTERAAANQVVRGMRASAAVAFAHWANEVTRGTAYRLPTAAEIEDPAVINALAGQLTSSDHVWVAPARQGDLPRLQPLDEAPDPHTISTATIQRFLDLDFAGAPFALGIVPWIIHARTAARILLAYPPLDVDLPTGFDPGPVIDVLNLLADGAPQTSALIEDVARELTELSSTGLVQARRLVDELDRACRAAVRTADPRRTTATADNELRCTQALYLAGVIVHDLSLLREYEIARIRYFGDPYDAWPPGLSADLTCDLGLASAFGLGRDPGDDSGRDVQSLVHYADLHGGLNRRRSRRAARNRLEYLVIDHRFMDVSVPLLGNALSSVLDAQMLSSQHGNGTVQSAESAPSISVTLAQKFASLFLGLRPDYQVSADLLASTIPEAINALDNLIGAYEPHYSTEWASRLNRRFEELTAALLAGGQRIDAPLGRALRIMAFCLTAEADLRDPRGIGDAFRRIAATITWLQRRQSGDDPPVEALVLAQN
jgi:hypothetical protein